MPQYAPPTREVKDKTRMFFFRVETFLVLLKNSASAILNKDFQELEDQNAERGNIRVSSRNLEVASSDLQALVTRTEEFGKIVSLLKENPTFVIYVEACRKGRSVTGAEEYDKDQLILFDIYDHSTEKFLPYNNAHQHAYHHNIPIVKLYAETRHRSMKDLLKFKNYALAFCKEAGLEGMVIKPRMTKIISKEGYDLGYVQAKVKLDIPEPKKRKIASGEPIYPPIPENEILGAIDKVWQELGTEKFLDVKIAMPAIAVAVGKAQREHLYSKPKGNSLFKYWQEYCERLVIS